jgi:hypothetical protein
MDTTTTVSNAPAFVVITQFRENYGAHDWDGTGECPQYWKFKGGDDYFIYGVATREEAIAAMPTLVCDNYSQTHILDVIPYSEWAADLPQDKEYRDFLISTVRHVGRSNA